MTSSLYESSSNRATLRFLVSAAAQTAIKGRTLIGGCTVGEAYLFSFADGQPVEIAEVDAMIASLTVMSLAGTAIETVDLPFAEACAYFEAVGLHRSLSLLKSRVSETVALHKLAAGLDQSGHPIMRLALQPLATDAGVLRPAPPTLLLHAGKLLVTYGQDSTATSQEPKAKRAKSLAEAATETATLPPGVLSTSLLSASTDHAAWGSCLG